ncbi:hypothetical protein [Nocardia speluncae]|nr:hypothetical protein [Nocardia speluncae]
MNIVKAAPYALVGSRSPMVLSAMHVLFCAPGSAMSAPPWW